MKKEYEGKLLIALYDTKKQEIVGGSEKRVTLTAVDINKVTEFSLGVDGYFKFDDDAKSLSVKGKYAGETVNIPAAYWNDNGTEIQRRNDFGQGSRENTVTLNPLFHHLFRNHNSELLFATGRILTEEKQAFRFQNIREFFPMYSADFPVQHAVRSVHLCW